MVIPPVDVNVAAMQCVEVAGCVVRDRVVMTVCVDAKTGSVVESIGVIDSIYVDRRSVVDRRSAAATEREADAASTTRQKSS